MAWWRAETGFKHDRETTAADVVDHEINELGNEISLKVDRNYLENFSANQILWLGKTSASVRRYGSPRKVELSGQEIIVGNDGEGGYLVLDPMRKKNIARKADVPWQDPFIQARMTHPGMHTAWDEPEDHPAYPMAGDLQRQMVGRSTWQRLQAERRRMYGREKMNPAPYYGTYEFEEEPEIYCPACGGEPQYMGTLGDRDWFRCRRCGWQFAVKTNPASLAADLVALYETRGGAHQIVVVASPDGCYSIKEIDRGRLVGAAHGICSHEMLNNKIAEVIYYRSLDGINYDLVYP